MITKKIAVHIRSRDEAREVIDYYRKEYKYHTLGLTIENALEYPYLCLSDFKPNLLSGKSDGSTFDKVLCFSEWEDIEIGINILPFKADAIELLFA